MSLSPQAPLAPPDQRSRPRRLTRNDTLVLSRLRAVGRPVKAYDLLEGLRQDGINAPMTVYRALSRLTEMGLVKKIESINAFCALSEPRSGDIDAFLICRRCDVILQQPVPHRRIEELVGTAFAPDRATIELVTDCLATHPANKGHACGGGSGNVRHLR